MNESAGSNYQVIARRYRPRFFREVVGQEAVALTPAEDATVFVRYEDGQGVERELRHEAVAEEPLFFTLDGLSEGAEQRYRRYPPADRPRVAD